MKPARQSQAGPLLVICRSGRLSLVNGLVHRMALPCFSSEAECVIAGDTSTTRPAAKCVAGKAAQHHDRTGHTVSVEVNGNVIYCNDEEHAKKKAKKAAGE